MYQKYLIKHAWECTHQLLGDIVCFVASPYGKTSPYSYGYITSPKKDEVFRMASDSKQANMILHKLSKCGDHQWTHPNCDFLVEIEFNMDMFFDQEIFQENTNYNRDVLFHTDCDLL